MMGKTSGRKVRDGDAGLQVNEIQPVEPNPHSCPWSFTGKDTLFTLKTWPAGRDSRFMALW
jgi:hypothetical protein